MLSSAIAKKDIYIFKAMAPSAGYDILFKQLDQFSQANLLNEINRCIWLIRESNVPGMLTIDYIKLHDETHEWQCCSIRMALTAQGWVSALNPGKVVMLENITAENAAVHEQSLTDYITQLQNGKFGIKNRVNPRKDEQTQCEVYTKYIVNIGEDGAPGKRRREVELSPGVKQAITCELSQKPFKNPVVLRQNLRVRVQGWQFIDLYKGRSYEESELVKLNVAKQCYYTNFVLKNLINRLGCPDESKIESLSDDKLEDSVFYEQLENPVIIPSGHSFSQATIDKMHVVANHGEMHCPLTRQPFTMDQAVENINLNNFINSWDAELQVRSRLKL
ncbi:MAG: U-box domain-containing protein [Candidatus Berkiella sp.]